MANNAIMQVKTSFGATLDGTTVVFRQGELIDADHPAVRKWPEHFDVPTVTWSTRKTVEQATAAPGEKRGDPLAAYRQLVKDAKDLGLDGKGSAEEIQAAIDAKLGGA
jgi:hypothetical protein